jgi:hypothetical protein
MDGKEILRQHIAKTVALTDEQFDYFFSHSKPRASRKDRLLYVKVTK